MQMSVDVDVNMIRGYLDMMNVINILTMGHERLFLRRKKRLPSSEVVSLPDLS